MTPGRPPMSDPLSSVATPEGPAGQGPGAPGGADGGLVRVCNVSTRCTSREAFVRAFAGLIDDTTLFIPARMELERGQAVRFQFALRDGSPIFAGYGHVREVHLEPAGAGRRAGVLVQVQRVDESSRDLR